MFLTIGDKSINIAHINAYGLRDYGMGVRAYIWLQGTVDSFYVSEEEWPKIKRVLDWELEPHTFADYFTDVPGEVD